MASVVKHARVCYNVIITQSQKDNQMSKSKYRYHLSAYFSDFVEAETEDEAMDIFADMFTNAKRSDITWEVEDYEEIGDDE